jgi:hypothetical protein
MMNKILLDDKLSFMTLTGILQQAFWVCHHSFNEPYVVITLSRKTLLNRLRFEKVVQKLTIAYFQRAEQKLARKMEIS